MLHPRGERAARRAARSWERYNSTGNRTELAELGGLSADGTASHEPDEEEIPSLARTVSVCRWAER